MTGECYKCESTGYCLEIGILINRVPRHTMIGHFTSTAEELGRPSRMWVESKGVHVVSKAHSTSPP